MHANHMITVLLQRYPEPDTKSAGTETTQVLGHQVMEVLWSKCSHY